MLKEYNPLQSGAGLYLGTNFITTKLPCMKSKESWLCNTRIPNELIVVFSRYVYTSNVNQIKETNKTFVQL